MIFSKFVNIDYGDVLESYKEISDENIYGRANWILLKLLLAYDKSGSKRKDISMFYTLLCHPYTTA